MLRKPSPICDRFFQKLRQCESSAGILVWGTLTLRSKFCSTDKRCLPCGPLPTMSICSTSPKVPAMLWYEYPKDIRCLCMLCSLCFFVQTRWPRLRQFCYCVVCDDRVGFLFNLQGRVLSDDSPSITWPLIWCSAGGWQGPRRCGGNLGRFEGFSEMPLDPVGVGPVKPSIQQLHGSSWAALSRVMQRSWKHRPISAVSLSKLGCKRCDMAAVWQVRRAFTIARAYSNAHHVNASCSRAERKQTHTHTHTQVMFAYDRASC